MFIVRSVDKVSFDFHTGREAVPRARCKTIYLWLTFFGGNVFAYLFRVYFISMNRDKSECVRFNGLLGSFHAEICCSADDY